MKLLKTIKEQDIYPNHIQKNESNYRKRIAGRTVLFDENKNIALLYVSKAGYYKLPGGGVEKDESPIEAAVRETLEEAGCNLEITGEIGKIVEYRGQDDYQDSNGIIQTSFCYIAQVIGTKKEPSFEPDEIKEGFQLVWISIDEAIKLIEQSSPTTYDGGFIIKRDLIFLEEAKKSLNK
ncbi:MAG: NUDIX domain-containing protein [Candidatus Paceibacterota bacterium]|jgi:8-oxo-dGTP pyrophosphatase MutT (NUDIX family)